MNLHKVSCDFFFGFYVDRGEFDIYGTTILKIEMLNWKYYSELLAAWVRYEERFSIQIQGFSNFHWYLKQKWRYFAKNKLMFAWDSERPIYDIWYSWNAYGLVTWFTLHISRWWVYSSRLGCISTIVHYFWITPGWCWVPFAKKLQPLHRQWTVSWVIEPVHMEASTSVLKGANLMV